MLSGRVPDLLLSKNSHCTPANGIRALTRADFVTMNGGFLTLTAAAGPAAVLALIATPVARHHAAALRAHRRIGRDRRERQRFLWTHLCRPQRRRLARLIHRRVLGAEKFRRQPSENVI